MVDILEASGARRPKPGLAATPTSSISADRIVQPYTEMAKALGAAGEALTDASAPYHTAEGAKAVTKDADGNLQVQWRGEFTANDRAYNAAARASALAMSRTDVGAALLELRNQYDGRPAEFKKVADDYIRTVGKNGDPLLRPFLQDEARRQAGHYFEGLISSKHDLDIRRAHDSLNAREGLLVDELETLASQGGTATEAFKAKRAELEDLRNAKLANPKFVYDAERRKVDDTRLDTGLKAAAIIGIARRDYERDGDLPRAQRTAEQELDRLSLPTNEKLKYLGQVNSRLTGANAVRQAELAAVKEEAQSLQTLYGQGQTVDNRRYDETIAKLRAGRAYGAAYNLEAARLIAENRPVVRSGTAAQAIDTITRVQAGAGATGSGGDYYSSIRAAESGGDDTARNPNSTATGRYQFTAPTWQGLMRNHPELGLTANGRLDPEQQERAIRVFTEENRATLARSGLPGSNQNLYAAHFLGAGGAVPFIQGALANPDAQAAALVSGDTAAANRTVFFRPDGTARSAGEVYAWMAKKSGGGLYANPMLPEVVKALQGSLNERVKETWGTVRKALDEGLSPSQQEISDLATLLPKTSDVDLRKEIGDRLGVEQATQAIAGMSILDRERIAAASRQTAEDGFATPIERDIVTAWEKQNAKLRKVMMEEPTRYGSHDPALGLATPRPLDLSSNSGLAASLGERRTVLAAVKQINPETPDIVLSNQDRSQLASVLSQSDGQTASGILGALATLPPKQFGAVFDDAGIRDAVIGMARSGDPAKMTAAFSVLDAERRRDPDAFTRRFPGIEDRLDVWTSKMAFMPAEAIAKEMSRVDDPAMQKARQALTAEAEKKTKNLTGADVAGYFDESPMPFTAPGAPAQPLQAGELKADFDREFAGLYAELGDEGKAREIAVERLKRVWAPSALNGGRLTRFAPERSPAYPPINGSHDWMAKQLDNDVRMTVAGMGGRAFNVDGQPGDLQDPAWVESPGARAILSAPRMLVPDARTQAEFTSGQRPSYQIVIQAPNGMFVPLANAQGQPARFTADPDLEMSGRRAAALATFGGVEEARASQERFDADIERRAADRRARRGQR